MEAIKLESGYYWVRLKYRVTVSKLHDEWEICFYNAEDNEWFSAGSEIEVDEDCVAEIDERRLTRSENLMQTEECVCEKYAEQRTNFPNCMSFWCPVHDDIEAGFARLERATMPTRYSEAKPDEN